MYSRISEEWAWIRRHVCALSDVAPAYLECLSQEVSVFVDVITDSWPGETYFQVTRDDTIVFETGLYPFHSVNTTYTTSMTLYATGDYVLHLFDTYGDGQQGHVSIYLAGSDGAIHLLASYDGSSASSSPSFLFENCLNFTVSKFPRAISSCSACGEGQHVTNPNGTWVFDDDISFLCSDIEVYAANGLLAGGFCESLPSSSLATDCGCARV